jgi:hypothetical protein
MNEICEWTRENLPAYLDRELREDERRRVEEHLAACVACRSELEAHRASWDLFRGELPDQPIPEELRRNPFARERLFPAWLAPTMVGLAGAAAGFVLFLLRPPTPPAAIPTAEKLGMFMPPVFGKGGSGLVPAPLPPRTGRAFRLTTFESVESGLSAAPRFGTGGSGLNPTPIFSTDGSGLPCAPFEPAQRSSLGPGEEYFAQRTPIPPLGNPLRPTTLDASGTSGPAVGGDGFAGVAQEGLRPARLIARDGGGERIRPGLPRAAPAWIVSAARPSGNSARFSHSKYHQNPGSFAEFGLMTQERRLV